MHPRTITHTAEETLFALVAAFLSFGAAAPAAAEDPVAHAARLAASRKLANERCLKVFADFQDASGRPLAEKLDALGETGQSYLSLIYIYDAGEDGPCAGDQTLAITQPGSRAVYICGANFRVLARRRPGFAAAILIHEELHSIGLPDDMPSSAEITSRVVARCGS